MTNIAVFFGGRSAEHDVSIITALTAVIAPLSVNKENNVIPVYISKDGGWYSFDELLDISTYQSSLIDEKLKKEPKLSVSFDEGLVLIKGGKFAGRKQYINIDVAFPAMHGTNGEDGSLMGVFEMAGVPYVGCSLAASALSMDKIYSKMVAQANSIPTPKMVHIDDHSYVQDMNKYIDKIDQELNYPLFVKPSSLGSSIGVSKVEDKQQLENAIEVALRYGERALVEEAVNNPIEVTVPITGNVERQVALVERPLVSEGVFDFDTKYLKQGKGKSAKAPSQDQEGVSSGSQGYSEVPAKIDKDLYRRAENMALLIGEVFNLEGIARIDLLIDEKESKVYFNEINPLPGSLYMHNFRAAGMSSSELVERLVDLAKDRSKKRQSYTTVFNTNFLRQF